MNLREYIKNNRAVFISAGLFSVLCFAYMLVTPGISIDEETWIQIEKPFAMWLVQGRWGIDLFNLLSMDQWRYAPVLWDFLAIVLWNLGGVLFSYALFEEKVKKIPLFFFQSYLCSLPFVLGEMFSFSMFSLQIALGMLSVSAAFLYSLRAAKSGKYIEWLLALLLIVFAFSVYQAYICVYITAVGAYSLKAFLEKKEHLMHHIIRWAAVCLTGIGIYYGINFILMKVAGSSSYLTDNYVGWFDKGGVFKALFMSLANIVRVSLAIPVDGVQIYGGGVIRAVTIAFMIFVIWNIIKEKGIIRRLGILFYSLVLAASPFALFLVLGTYKTHGRVLLGLSLAGAMEIYLMLSCLKKQAVKKAGIVAGVYLLFLNAKNMNMLFYSANVAYEYDRTIANQVMYDIKRLGCDYHHKPIVFIGMAKMDDVGLPKSDTVGSSIFSWDDGNNARICNFMKTQGYRVIEPSAQIIQSALKSEKEMNIWPMEGSIRETDDYITVMLSKPTVKWYTINQAEKSN